MAWSQKEKQLAMMQTRTTPRPYLFRRNPGVSVNRTKARCSMVWCRMATICGTPTFFCGSCAVIRRKPLDEIGGIAVETVTEDAQTSLAVAPSWRYLRVYAYSQAAAGDRKSALVHIG
ncbi:glycosyltransferase family 2 protein [Escherichia coli]